MDHVRLHTKDTWGSKDSKLDSSPFQPSSFLDPAVPWSGRHCRDHGGMQHPLSWWSSSTSLRLIPGPLHGPSTQTPLEKKNNILWGLQNKPLTDWDSFKKLLLISSKNPWALPQMKIPSQGIMPGGPDTPTFVSFRQTYPCSLGWSWICYSPASGFLVLGNLYITSINQYV